MDLLNASLRQILVFIHLFTFAFAVVEVIKKDYHLLKVTKLPLAEIKKTGKLLSTLLFILWITGSILIYMSVGSDISLLLSNGKLMAKITVVMLLTMNGFTLHYIAFPLMQKPNSYSALLCSIFGAISGVSWLFASFIGAARILALQLSYADFIGAYLFSLVFAFFVAIIFVRPHLQQLLTERSLRLRNSKPLLNVTC